MAEFTGRKMLAVVVSFFGVIIAVNGFMAKLAISTFPGLEVPNSYVASQTWDANNAAQKALGWTVAVTYDSRQSQFELIFTDRNGLPAEVSDLTVLVGRPTETQNDSYPAFVHEGSAFRAPLSLAPGKWMVKIEATAPDGTRFSQRRDLRVQG